MTVLIHSSSIKIDEVFPEDQRVDYLNQWKPIGLWYAEGTAWLNFHVRTFDSLIRDKRRQNGELFVIGNTYFYFIKLRYTSLSKPNKDRVLAIRTVKQFDDFTIKYGFVYEQYPTMMQIRINWYKVSQDFAGVEVIPFIKERAGIIKNDEIIQLYAKRWNIKLKQKYVIFWIEYWDVPSGCVWNPIAIKKMALITKDLYLETGEKIKSETE